MLPNIIRIEAGYRHAVIFLDVIPKQGTYQLEEYLVIRIDKIEIFANKNPEIFRSLLQFFSSVVDSKQTYDDSPMLVEFAERFVEGANLLAQNPAPKPKPHWKNIFAKMWKRQEGVR